MNETDLSLQVRRAQQQFWIALQSKDRTAMEKLLSDDFLARSPNQPNQGRAEFIDSLTGFPAQVRSIESDNLEIHIWGDLAVVTGVQSAEIDLADGQVRMNRIAITNVFQHQQGQWKMKLSHAIALD